MNSGNVLNTSIDVPQLPYVGMRAFAKNEQAIFFGRKHDASLLRDKVFSARLTVVYGPSGVGKSSILHTLLIPYLEEEEARVVYFDNWTGSNPLMTLKYELIAEAKKLQIPEPEAGSPSLTDLILLLQSADNRTLILILDQFEEFFTHGNNPDILRKELGALIRASDLDVRVLLSLREEHLAALEPFRAEILNLFQSTYRLEPLRDEGIREAIEGPAKLFGVDFEPGLVSELINDLRHQDNVTRWDPQTGMAVDLPMLQLICSELWKEMARQGRRTITRSLYRVLGGQKSILDSYLRQVMPRNWQHKKLTAQLMRYLAPSDGHKAFYSAENLAELEELDCDRVEKELQRLSDPEVRVLRDRSYEDNVFYELYHDRFISFIAPWRDRILQYDRLRNKIKLVSSVFFSIILLTGFIIIVSSELGLREYKRFTDQELGKLNHAMAEPEKQKTFENVAQYLLGKKREEDMLDRLTIYLGRKKESFDNIKQLFQQYESFLPKDYGIDRKKRDDWQKPQEGLLTLKYSPVRELDENLFWNTWKDLSIDLTKNSDIIMVPIRLNLEKNETSGETLVRLVGKDEEDIEALEIEVPLYENNSVIDPRDLSETGIKFKEKFNNEWKQVGPYLVVPRWSVPVWKSLNVQPIGGSKVTAYQLLEAVKAHPDRLLTVQAVDAMLERVAEQYPQSVAEAKAVRQERLRQDLQEILKQGIPLTKLASILDTLSHYPADSSSEVASIIATDLNQTQINASYQLRGPHQQRESKTAASDAEREKCKRFPWFYRRSADELEEVIRREKRKSKDITADKIHEELSTMKPEVKSWLETNYSLTDLKLLLRASWHPAQEELVVDKAVERSESTTGGINQPSSEANPHQPARLLSSLVFWSQAGDGRSFPALAEALRRLQNPRLVPELNAKTDPQILNAIKSGIKALHEGRVCEAEANFGLALRTDKDSAIANFLALYAKEFQQQQL